MFTNTSTKSIHSSNPLSPNIMYAEEIEFLKSKKIGILYAGEAKKDVTVLNETFNPRGWKSYQAVALGIAASLRSQGFQNVVLLAEGLELIQQIREQKIDLIWLNTAGIQGFDGILHAAALLESMGIPYIGHTPSVAGIMDNKYLFKKFMIASELPTSNFFFWSHLEKNDFNELESYFEKYPSKDGYIVKPIIGRASHHVIYSSSLKQASKLASSINEKTKLPALIEEFLPGREFTIASNGPKPIGILERKISPYSKIFESMDKCPIQSSRVLHLSESKDDQIKAYMEQLCQKACRALCLHYLVRMDLREDSQGHLKILEMNPKPDLHPHTPEKTSLLLLAAEASQMSYDDLILSQIQQFIKVSEHSFA